MDRYSVSLGMLIVKRRKELGKTQKVLASDLCISTQYLSDIERGMRHPIDIWFLENLASTLQLSKDYVFYLTGQVPPDIRRMDATPEQIGAAFDMMRALYKAFGRVE